MAYTDTISRSDTSEETEFPYEPKGNPYPKRKKTIASEWSIPAHDDDDNFLPAVESIKDNGVDANSGIWELRAEGIDETTYLKLKEFAEDNPPDDFFIYYKHRIDTNFLVKFIEFDEEFLPRFNIYNINFTLKNRGEIT